MKLYDAGDTDSDPGDKVKLLQEASASDVKVAKKEDTFPIHFKSPVALKAGHWYTLAVKGSGRKETLSGKGGQTKITGSQLSPQIVLVLYECNYVYTYIVLELY